ncbi:Protein of unknown function [Pyronema omphalodes CBS 100304]|uniref:Uncharacterized protein n=1 Tax=Pyronema omphalodes (strain CBS 100304) TaxID=1076935 RepID=U4LNG5_PYROM|nr:Protein of unknown function [Pyronema omphalodes CBS 100304]
MSMADLAQLKVHPQIRPPIEVFRNNVLQRINKTTIAIYPVF